jgi:tellurite resistance protein TehA-like permease
MAWWGWTFPAAAFSVATTLVMQSLGDSLAVGPPLAWAALTAATLIVALVSLATARAAAQGTLLLPE